MLAAKRCAKTAPRHDCVRVGNDELAASSIASGLHLTMQRSSRSHSQEIAGNNDMQQDEIASSRLSACSTARIGRLAVNLAVWHQSLDYEMWSRSNVLWNMSGSSNNGLRKRLSLTNTMRRLLLTIMSRSSTGVLWRAPEDSHRPQARRNGQHPRPSRLYLLSSSYACRQRC